MSIDRLKILEKLAAGSIDAETAAVMLQEKANPVERPDAILKVEETPLPEDEAPMPKMAVEAEPTEKAAESTIWVDEEPEPLNKAEIIAIEEEIEAETAKQSRIRVIVTGKPVKANLNITLPISLLKFGAHIGSYFTPEIDGAEGENLNVHIDTGDQQVRIFTEQAA